MLLQFIVAELDAELHRLQELRRIVNGISSASPLDGLLMELNQIQQTTPVVLPAPQTVTHTSSQPQPLASYPVTAGKGRGRSKHIESRALSSSIPAAPVVVYAAQVASERQRRVPVRTVAPGKNKAAAFMAKTRTEGTTSVEALRNRWLAEG